MTCIYVEAEDHPCVTELPEVMPPQHTVILLLLQQ